ncbi:MAG: hypothetical protein ACXVPU_02095, partial [Bacteroidia bacterium]
NSSFAQSFKAETSTLFQDDVGKPVFVMKDGTTIFQYDDLKERKMFLTVFDKNHNIIVNKKEVDFNKVKYVYHFSYQRSTNVSFWAEDDGKIIMYMESDFKPFKVTLDPKTAHVINEEEQDAEKIGIVSYSSVNSRTVGHSYVVKGVVDETTGNRLKINSTRKQLNKAEALAHTDFSDICTKEFVISNSNEKELKTIPFDFVDKKYQDARIINTLFDNNVIYFVSKEYKMTDRATYDAPNTGKGQVGTICFSKYDLSTKKFTHIEMYDIKDGIDFGNCTMLHNADYSVFNLRFIVKTGSTNGNIAKGGQTYYEIVFQPIDLKTFEMGKAYSLPSEKLDEFVKANCKLKNGYEGGMLDKCLVDKNGNLFTTKVKNVTSLSDFSTGYIYTQNPELIGVSCFDKTGKEISGAAYPYNTNGSADPFSMTNSVEISKNDFSYVAATGSKTNILFLNNLSDNFNLPLDKKPDYAKSLEDCNAMAIEFTNAGEMKQYYVFGEPKDKKSNMYVDFSRALYDATSNTYIVKVYDGPGYKKTHAAWIKME